MFSRIKIGPDYIDTLYHSRITKNSSRNLDNFLIPDTDYLEVVLLSLASKF